VVWEGGPRGGSNKFPKGIGGGGGVAGIKAPNTWRTRLEIITYNISQYEI
jgi:hypothetical protein